MSEEVKSLEEVVQVEEPSPEELDEAGMEPTSPAEVMDNAEEKAGETVDTLPEWAVIPPNMKGMKGKRVTFLYFKAEWTETPEKGDRWCALTSLTESDEKMALKACLGDNLVVLNESSKACIRVIDGVTADRTRRSVKGAVHIFWHDIGEKCRDQIKNWYVKAHRMSRDEKMDFFANCVVVATVT